MARSSGPLEEKGATGRGRLPKFAKPVGNQVYSVSAEKGNSNSRNLKGWIARIFGVPPLTLEKAIALIQRKGIKCPLAHFKGRTRENRGIPKMQAVGFGGQCA